MTHRAALRRLALATLFIAGPGAWAGEPASRHRTLADPLAEVHPSADAATITRLFDYAEQTYPAYFPSHRSNLSFPPYTYRYYPETGIYLGVSGDDVYLMGGPFGSQPVRVGRVSDFLPATPAAPNGTGNGCWDLDFMEQPGRQISVESRMTAASGAVTGGMTQEWLVLGTRSFEGQMLLATSTTVTLTSATGQVTSTQRNTSYTRRADAGGVTIFGDEGSMLTGPVNVSFRTVFSPPWTDTQHVLEVGQSVVESWTGTTTSQGYASPLQGSRTIRFVARETIDVPAGRFETCRFEQSQPSTPGLLTTWIARGWGLPVQVQGASGGSGGLTQAVRITVDGALVGTPIAAPTAQVQQ